MSKDDLTELVECLELEPQQLCTALSATATPNCFLGRVAGGQVQVLCLVALSSGHDTLDLASPKRCTCLKRI